jgi:ectoine hydroxylase-related dioxygenase (phytanoyl-CoA dioxygenase family)
MNDEQRQQLDEQGYVLLPAVLSPAGVAEVTAQAEAVWAAEGAQAGSENYIEPGVRRLANLANKGAAFRALMVHPQVLEAVQRVLGPAVRINMLNARDALPAARGAAVQPLHTDADHGAKADAHGYLVATAIWMLDPFTRANGATRLVPGTHLSPALPKEVLSDVLAPHPAEIYVTGQPGDVFIFNGHCWHAGGANHTEHSRRAILAHYARADQPQRLNQKDAIAPEVQATLSPLERTVLGLDG